MGRIPGRAEEKCVRLFQEILEGATVRPRHRFEFLRGDPTPKRSRGVPLAVDAYFPDFDLVLEYMGEQHFSGNPLMDRRPGRKAQRAAYQERRSQVLGERGIKVIRVRYDEKLTGEVARAKLREAGLLDKDGKVIWKAP